MSETDDLRALMEADRWIDRVQAQQTHLPEMAELAALEVELRAQLKALNDAQAALSPVRSAFESTQREGERLRARATALDRTLSTSTANARELAALQTELQHVRELLERSDDLELEQMMAVEPLDEAVKAIKAAAQPAVARRGELQATITELHASLDEELAALHEQRRERALVVAPELLGRYEAAMQRVGTSGAAQVVAGSCDGCRIALSPLDLDRWKGQPEGSFMNCPECGRLLLP
ncbi:MAG: C4-type zinc ribbon domain-containing protein [Acidimicrobiales bacterium]